MATKNIEALRLAFGMVATASGMNAAEVALAAMWMLLDASNAAGMTHAETVECLRLAFIEDETRHV